VASLLASEFGLGEMSLAENGFEGSGGNLFSSGGNDDGQDRVAEFAVLDVASFLGDKYKAEGFEDFDDLCRRIQSRHG